MKSSDGHLQPDISKQIVEAAATIALTFPLWAFPPFLSSATSNASSKVSSNPLRSLPIDLWPVLPRSSHSFPQIPRQYLFGSFIDVLPSHISQPPYPLPR